MDTNNEEQLICHTASEYQRRVCLAMNFISHNLDQTLTLEEIANAAFFSKFHFHRIFKAVVGETVSEFTRRLRLEAAANRLRSRRRWNITRIAFDCGFSSSQNFAKAFRQHFGMTPSAYRKSNLGNKMSKKKDAFSLRTNYNTANMFIHLSNHLRSHPMKAEVKKMPSFHVAYVRKIGPYGKETCMQAFGELMQWAGPRGCMAPGATVGMLYWDNPEVTPPDKCRVDAWVTVPEGTTTEGAVGLQNIRGGSYGVCNFVIKSDSFQQPWNDAFAWLVHSGYECDDAPCYELYHNDPSKDPEGKCIFDICIPLKQK